MLEKLKPFFVPRRRAAATLIVLGLIVFAILATILRLDPGRYGMDSPERLAAMYNLGIQPADVENAPPCDWKNPSKDQPSCMTLQPLPRRYCQWYSVDFCRPYEISALILDDPERLGQLTQAVADPCYESEQTPLTPNVRQACEHYGQDTTSIVIIFRGPEYDTQMRVDRE